MNILYHYQNLGGNLAGWLILLKEYNLLTIFGILSVLFLVGYSLFGGKE